VSVWGATLVSVTAVILTVADDLPRVVVVRRPASDAAGASETIDSLPSGPFDPAGHETLDRGLRQLVAQQTGLDLRYVEQLYTFGNRYRDPRELYGGPRVLSVAYLALTGPDPAFTDGRAQWRNGYSLLPWEDWRTPNRLLDDVIVPAIGGWVEQGSPALRPAREVRAAVCFGLGQGRGSRDPTLVLERFELLYEAGLLPEAVRDAAEQGRAARARSRWPDALPDPEVARRLGPLMPLDDRRVLAAALGRLRGKLAYRPVVFDLVPDAFTLLQLQLVVEALAGVRLHKQNFRRMVLHGELVEPTGQTLGSARGRPAELYRFRREVLRDRSVVGVGLPQARTTGAPASRG
jgi:hypothetical protein